MEGNAGKRKQADRAITDGKDCENHIANNRKSMKLGDHVIACPVCCQNFVGIPESLREKHVNGCLDKQDSFEQKEEFGQDIMTEVSLLDLLINFSLIYVERVSLSNYIIHSIWEYGIY